MVYKIENKYFFQNLKRPEQKLIVGIYNNVVELLVLYTHYANQVQPRYLKAPI